MGYILYLSQTVTNSNFTNYFCFYIWTNYPNLLILWTHNLFYIIKYMYYIIIIVESIVQ